MSEREQQKVSTATALSQTDVWGFVFTCFGVSEGETRFGVGQLVEVMKADDVRCLKVALGTLVAFPAPSDFIVKLGGGQRSQKRRVGAGNADSIV